MFEEPRFEFDAPHVVSKGVDRKTNEFIIVPHLLVCDAVIYLHHRLARAGNVASREACLKAAWRAMPVIRQVLDQNMGRSVFTYLTVTWLHIFQEFGCEYDRLQALQDLKRADVILRELKTLSRVLHEQSEYSPLASEFSFWALYLVFPHELHSIFIF
ncbi:hypothetical protein BOTBODRAFT_257167 [Botryobasidium botryosum FD-172 SS1]|uniref:Uncharacterized protein n=1 Tax=Botryobasidium botryosum (strain FD-172 SS1) TaxID=930990 RepID=A0A067MKX4_BOTB1|nr:hypothetical protein BOTBODRAFT_257167 [Botryobasidium botryosum FD-172 SS1]